jgi:FKBP-type peptidyl-prolyl cis-trans isomerase
MDNRLNHFLCLLLLCALAISCRHQAPQLPSNKGGNEANEKVKILLKMNTKLAQKEDSALNVYVQNHDKELQRNDLGFWYKIESNTDGAVLKEKDSCRFFLKITLLDGTVVSEETKSAVMGHKEMIVGLEEGLKLLHKGETARFLIPWYLAFGRKGNDSNLPPYTSICCKVKLFN